MSLKNEGRGRERLLKLIQEKSYQRLYQRKLRRLLGIVSIRIFKDYSLISSQRKNRASRTFSTFRFLDTFTASSFSFLLRLSLVYPVVFMTFNWVLTGTGGEIGKLEILINGVFIYSRLFYLIAISLVFILFIKGARSVIYFLLAIVLGQTVAVFFNGVVDSAFTLVFTLSIASLFIVTVAKRCFDGIVERKLDHEYRRFEALVYPLMTAFFIAFIGIPIILAALVSSGGTAILIGMVFILIFVFAITIFCEIIKHKIKQPFVLTAFKVISLILFILNVLYTIYWVGGGTSYIDKNSLLILIFLVVLPLANSPFDWISLGITRSLLYDIVDNINYGVLAVFWSVFDIVIALLLLVGVISATTITIAGTNFLFQMQGNYAYVIDLNTIFNDLQNRQLKFESRYIWLYMVFLSTLIPTIIHLLIAAWAVISWFPARVLDALGRDWKENQLSHDLPKLLVATVYFSIFLPIAFFSPFLILYIFYVIIVKWGYGEIIGDSLLGSMKTLAMLIDPSIS